MEGKRPPLHPAPERAHCGGKVGQEKSPALEKASGLGPGSGREGLSFLPGDELQSSTAEPTKALRVKVIVHLGMKWLIWGQGSVSWLLLRLSFVGFKAEV